MAKDHSFDIVSKVNLQEVRNAIQMAHREISTRYDFKGSNASVTLTESPPSLELTADHEAQLRSVLDVVEFKLTKRNVPLKAFAWQSSEPLPSGGIKRRATLQQGLSQDNARAIIKAVKGLGLKVQMRIDGDSVRVSAKQIDDLQVVISTLKDKDICHR